MGHVGRVLAIVLSSLKTSLTITILITGFWLGKGWYDYCQDDPAAPPSTAASLALSSNPEDLNQTMQDLDAIVQEALRAPGSAVGQAMCGDLPNTDEVTAPIRESV